MISEDWGLVTSFLPANWQELAVQTKAVKGLRKNKSADTLLRTLFLHLANGYSLRETAARAKLAGLADLSDVALLKRLRKSEDWLHAICLALFAESEVSASLAQAHPIRVFDATTVSEPGKTGSIWRIHYSIQLPSLECDFFQITLNKGKGTGESFSQFPINAGDYIIADAGYSRGVGIGQANAEGAYLCFRVNTQCLVLFEEGGGRFPLEERLKEIDAPGKIGCWTVFTPGVQGQSIRGRLCVIKKSHEAAQQTQRRLKRKASRKGTKLNPKTLFYAEYVIIFTTFPDEEYDAAAILELYRVRWQIELVFKRFKQIAQLGHLPKYDEESARAWLYGKLLIALLSEKIIHHAASISPWGYYWQKLSTAESLA